MKKVFVSGCYDIVHAGHIQFFEEARALGDYLIVSFASEPVLWHHKQRKPSIPDEHKKVLLESLRSAYDGLYASRAGQAYMEGLPRCQIVPCAFSSEANQVGVAAAYFEAMQKKC